MAQAQRSDEGLPRWEWDSKLGALVPVCPGCGDRLAVDSTRMTCKMLGFSHFHERVAYVLDATQKKLSA